MPVAATLPAYANITELQLRVVTGQRDDVRPLNKRRISAPLAREMWAGQVSFAAMSTADIRRFHAWLAALDGRVNAFGLPLDLAWYAETTVPGGATLNATPSGSDTVQLSAVATMNVGAFLSVGPANDTASQLVEIVARHPTVNTRYYVAPRIRKAIAGGTVIPTTAPVLPVRLTSDKLDVTESIAYGVVTLDVIEAVD